MITSGAVPAPLPAHLGVSQISQIATSQDFADPLDGGVPGRGPTQPIAPYNAINYSTEVSLKE